MSNNDEITIEPEAANTNLTSEPSLSGLNESLSGLNVQDDTGAQAAAADRAQKEQDLKKLDDEIRMLRQVLLDKINQAKELRKELGQQTPLDTVDDLARDLEKNINEWADGIAQTDAFKKTTTMLAEVGETTVQGAVQLGSLVGAKLGEVGKSDAFTTIAGKASELGGAVVNSVKNMGTPTQREFNEGGN